jgi:DNA polymerase-4
MKGMQERHIIHCDMDAFYAAVEQRDRPELKGRPVIVGGGLQRGVVSACSYEARDFGIHSAMPMTRAVQRCPQAVILPVRMDRYRAVSNQVFSIFERFTDRIEILSIDEAFLDVTGCERLFGPAAVIAASIRRLVRAELDLAVSAGVAPNKLLAKLASQRAKPDGLLEVSREGADDFLLSLPISALWGVGKVTEKLLKNHGISTVEELRKQSRPRLEKLLGQAGAHLFDLARGLDDEPVATVQTVKSVGHEETFTRDLRDTEALGRVLCELAERVAVRLREMGLKGRRVVLKVRHEDFATVTRSHTLPEAVDHGGDIYRSACELLRRTQAGPRAVRLLGVTVTALEERAPDQGHLFGPQGERQRLQALDRAVDSLRRRFGREPVHRGDLLPSRKKSGGSDPDQKGGDPCK